MSVFSNFNKDLLLILEELAGDGILPAGLDVGRVTVEPPRDSAHGDLSTNAAMVLAKQAGMKPRDLAAMIVERCRALPNVVEAEIAGPGFVNLRVAASVWLHELEIILREGTAYGESDMGGGALVNVEYVSANPTGPLHVGHARGTVFGDVLAALLEKTGHKVTREYYINDAGSQVDTLARSAYLRYREALGEDIGTIPSGLYPGAYLEVVGRALAARDGDKWRDVDEQEWLPVVRDFAISAMMDLVRDDLAALGVRQEVFTSERTLVDEGAVDAALAALQDRGLIYTGVLKPPKGKAPEDWEPRPQTLFRATEFGDDVDRPLRKSDGSWTYFASDIANHYDKYRRGFRAMIDVWGADHGGYIKRMKAAVAAVSDGEAELDVKICQMVNLLDNGAPIKMSKRAGSFVTMRAVIDEVGKDVIRFIMLTRKNDAPLDFDLAKVTEQSRDNPVFYVQYAHARHCSVMRQARETFPDADLSDAALAGVDLSPLGSPEEMALVKAMATWPRALEAAAEAHEPHRLAFYLYDLAAAFHHLWTKGRDDASLRFVKADDMPATLARMALVRAMAIVIASGLEVFDVTPVEEMR
ncbi:MAG: arginine--tRNA ligase [Alphaproteobacteria bacterium]|nr:arginine--tRNA ligase [Alphaproteobacteria bacterium]